MDFTSSQNNQVQMGSLTMNNNSDTKIMFFSRSWHNEQLSLTYHLRTLGVIRMTAWLGDIHRKQWLMEAILHKNTLHSRTTIEYDPVSSGLSRHMKLHRICKWVKVRQLSQFESATSVKHTWNHTYCVNVNWQTNDPIMYRVSHYRCP